MPGHGINLIELSMLLAILPSSLLGGFGDKYLDRYIT